MSTTIFILYNAKASILGKISYGYKKICSKPEDSVCAACEITHGGLSLNESEEWKATKQKIPATIKQLHQDELTPELQGFMRNQNLKFPAVIGQQGSSNLVLLMNAEDLKPLSKDHSAFLKTLESRAQANNLSWPNAAKQNL